MKKDSLLLAGFVVFILSILFTPFAFSAERSLGEKYAPSDVQEAVADLGQVRVIVTFTDDGVEALQKASSSLTREKGEALARTSAEHPDNVLADAIASRAAAVNARVAAKSSQFQPGRPFRISNGMTAVVGPDALAALQNDPDVKSVVLDIPAPVADEAMDAPSSEGDESLEIPDGPLLNDSIDIIGARVAWGDGYVGGGWYVAILDTGVLTSHEMFTGKVNTQEACFSSNYTDSSGPYDSISNCPNGTETQYGAGAAAPNSVDHGTHVAGIALGNNQNWSSGEPRYGVAPAARLLAVQVFSFFPNDEPPAEYTWTSDQVRALEWIYDNRNTWHIAAINMSLGGGIYGSACDSDIRAPIIGMLRTAGIATAIATGNEEGCSFVSAPSCISDAIAVGATDKSDNRASYSNFVASIQDVFAPGSSILSATIGSNSSYGYKFGTSMATPHVAGAFAVLRSKNPTASVNQLEASLENTGTQVPTNTIYCSATTPSPRINIDQALYYGGTIAPIIQDILE